ncbi:DUF6227 family protein [Streptomyces sp. TRM49041]|uniref:DUF6227 family protein n=1 Tax=Streptomyces sp. TRM49041 TaxID=2603216 RepID=UPI0021CD0810|nr:DUF6227 family protein [Streptomyces sp. TRM49041]
MPRVYVPDDPADHARRVLRRVENADRPGDTVAARGRARGARAPHPAGVRPSPVRGVRGRAHRASRDGTAGAGVLTWRPGRREARHLTRGGRAGP